MELGGVPNLKRGHVIAGEGGSTLEEAGAAADGRLGFRIAPVSVNLWVIGS